MIKKIYKVVRTFRDSTFSLYEGGSFLEASFVMNVNKDIILSSNREGKWFLRLTVEEVEGKE